LTSKEDSLARQYLDLKHKKDNLDAAVLSMNSLNTRTMEQKSGGGFSTGRVQIYLREVPVGSLEWHMPDRLNHGERQPGEVSFSAESIDYVRVNPDERQMLRSLGDRLKLQVKLASTVATVEVKPAKEDRLQEVGERERATWRWDIYNGGNQDSRLLLGVRFVNRNADDIPVFLRELPIASSSVVRQARDYLQPIPIALGVVIGFLLFGIVGIFRRVTHHGVPGERPTAGPGASKPPHIGHKKL
jgi:hypothetical protein